MSYAAVAASGQPGGLIMTNNRYRAYAWAMDGSYRDGFPHETRDRAQRDVDAWRSLGYTTELQQRVGDSWIRIAEER